MPKTEKTSSDCTTSTNSNQILKMGNLEFNNRSTDKEKNNEATDKKDQLLKAVLVPTQTDNEKHKSCTTNTFDTLDNTTGEVETITTTCSGQCVECSTKAIVPATSSLPCRLLRLNAKRIAHAIRQEIDTETIAKDLENDLNIDNEKPSCTNSKTVNATAAEEISTNSSDKSQSSVNVLSEETLDEKNDAGMGSSIECSEESEEDDELKPLAIDNHVLSNKVDEVKCSVHQQERLTDQPSTTTVHTSTITKELSQANLEQFHKIQHSQMDNIYMHPNFQYANGQHIKTAAEAMADNCLPADKKRTHRSFLNMKKTTLTETIPEKANSAVSQSSNASENKSNTVNEIDNLDPSLIPNDEMATQITKAVEYYFSDDSILKDAFLLKHVRRNKEGFVSLKLISSFKLVRQLTKDWRVVGHAVRRKSLKVQLNQVGTKVRRLEPLPNFDETMPSRTIVACDLPMDKLSIEKVSDIFSKCGEIALIRILKPGMAIPVDVRQFMNKYPEMQQKECALVEYLESASARNARNMQGPFKIYEMVAPKKKTGKKAIVQLPTPIARMVENYRQFNEQHGERTRGGSFSGPVRHEFNLRYKLKRNNSDIVPAQPPSSPYYYPSAQPPYNVVQPNDTFTADYNLQQQQQYNQHSQYYKARGSISQETSTTNPNSAGVNPNFYNYGTRRYSTASTIAANESSLSAQSNHIATNMNTINNGNFYSQMRRYSNTPQDISTYSDIYRRLSKSSGDSSRRESSGSESYMYSRRLSDYGHNDMYRKESQGAILMNNIDRRYSNNPMQYERTLSNSNDNGIPPIHRRISSEYSLERKPSMEIHEGNLYDDGQDDGYNLYPRRYSNNFNNISSKLAAYDNAQYINGRRMSTDSGYDRRFSFGSEYEGSPRSRTGSFLNNYKNQTGDFEIQPPRSRTNSFLDGTGTPRSRSGSFVQRAAESLVRTPIGPDGSKGFANRMRKPMEAVASAN